MHKTHGTPLSYSVSTCKISHSYVGYIIGQPFPPLCPFHWPTIMRPLFVQCLGAGEVKAASTEAEVSKMKGQTTGCFFCPPSLFEEATSPDVKRHLWGTQKVLHADQVTDFDGLKPASHIAMSLRNCNAEQARDMHSRRTEGRKGKKKGLGSELSSVFCNASPTERNVALC